MWEEKKAGKEAMFVWPKSFINFVACISVEITGCKNNVEVVKQIKVQAFIPTKGIKGQ